MNALEATRVALRALAANKLRGLLTMLGVIIGVAAAITLMLAFMVSAAVALFFGVYPAMRASRLSPIDALRYE